VTHTEDRLPRSTPEAQGIPSSAILAFVEAAEKDARGLHSFMLLRHGNVVAEGWWYPYAPEYPHMLFSLSKSFTSTAVGLAVAEGRLSVDDPVLSFFPEDAPAKVSENLAALRVRHLLSMSTGHDQDTTEKLHQAPDGNWVKAFLKQPVTHEPGTHFLYNSGATYILSAIVQRLTGMTVLDYLGPRLLEPLNIEGATWETCPRGINTGGWGLSIRTEGIARFGQLYLQRGLWHGRRLLPEAWVQTATSRQISNGTSLESDWEQGYGYQFWLCRHGAYRGDGAFGQFCVILPDQDAVVAITGGMADMQPVLNLIWTHLLPALGPASLPEDSAAHAELDRKLASLALLPAQGQASSPLAEKVSGKRYTFAAKRSPLKAIAFDFAGDEAICALRDGWGEHEVRCGCGAWSMGTTALNLLGPRPDVNPGVSRAVAASGAWLDPQTYALKLWFYETPFCFTLTCKFVNNRLKLNLNMNVSFGPTEWPQLVGQLTEAS